MLDVTYYVKWTNWGRQAFIVGFYALGLEMILLTVNWGYRCQRLNFSVVSLYSFSLFSSDIFEFSRNSFLNTFWDLSFSFLFTAPVVIWEYCWCDNKCGGWEVFYNPMIRCQSFCDLWPYCDLLCPSVAQESWRGMQWVFLFPHAEDWSWFNLGISLSLGWLDSCKVQGG